MEEFEVKSCPGYPWDFVTRLPISNALENFIESLPHSEYSLGIGTSTHVMIFFNNEAKSKFEGFILTQLEERSAS